MDAKIIALQIIIAVVCLIYDALPKIKRDKNERC